MVRLTIRSIVQEKEWSNGIQEHDGLVQDEILNVGVAGHLEQPVNDVLAGGFVERMTPAGV